MRDSQSISIELIEGEVPPLEKIVLKLNVSAADARPEVIDQVVVQYDRKKGVAERLGKNKFSLAGLFRLKKPVEYYRVDTYKYTVVSFTKVYRVKYSEFGELKLILKFSVSAREDREAVLVAELMRRDTANVILDNKIHEWITRGISDNMGILFTNYHGFVTEFTAFLFHQATGVGLKLDVVTEYEGELPGQTIQCLGREIQIQPREYNNFLLLGFDAVLVPDKQVQLGTLVTLGFKYKEKFQDRLTAWMQEYIRETVTYNDIAEHLHFRVRTQLIEYWNRKLQADHSGWLVAELALLSGDVPPAIFKIESVEIEGILSNARVPLVNTVSLNLENAERFKNARVESLETWVKDKLQQITHNILSKKSYAELVSDIEELTGIIERDLDKQASSIGYRVEYLLTSDVVNKTRLNFEFGFLEEEQLFQTSLGKEVKLNIVATGRIKSLKHATWLNTLLPETDFAQEMKKEILREVRQLLARVDADDYYAKFREVVEPRLVSVVRTLLIEHFNVDPSVDVLPQMGISALHQIIADLQRGQQQVDIHCFGESAVFRVTFSIMSVDPLQWSLFAGRSQITAEEIKNAVGERIRVFVENAVRLTIADANILRDARMFTLIEKYAKQSDKTVRDKLGLVIDVIDVEQLSNQLAEMVADTNLAFVQAKIQKLMIAIKKVDDEILDRLENDLDYDIDELEDKKAKLQNRLDNERFAANRLSFQGATQEFKQLMQQDGDKTEPDNPNQDEPISDDNKGQ